LLLLRRQQQKQQHVSNDDSYDDSDDDSELAANQSIYTVQSFHCPAKEEDILENKTIGK
jgi:hypothetical protein